MLKFRIRVQALHWFAKAMGLLVHVEGMPFGSARNVDRANGSYGLAHGQSVGTVE